MLGDLQSFYHVRQEVECERFIYYLDETFLLD